MPTGELFETDYGPSPINLFYQPFISKPITECDDFLMQKHYTTSSSTVVPPEIILNKSLSSQSLKKKKEKE